MVIECGFFNSINGDRKYPAALMNKPYDKLVSNGVLATPAGTPSDQLQVYSYEGMTICVKAGFGRFFDKWYEPQSDKFFKLDAAEVTLNRIDSVIVRADNTESVRDVFIYIKKGTPASSPKAPELERTNLVREYRLANIAIGAGVSEIVQANITDTRGYTDECGWITSLVQQVDTSTLTKQFENGYSTWFNGTKAEYETWLAESDNEFKTWHADVKENLSTSTLMREYSNTYTTTEADETVIPIGIANYCFNLDILHVYINGMKLIKGTDYTSADNNEIILTNGVDAGTPIHFVVLKSADGEKAETVIEHVEALQDDVTSLKGISITSETGGVKIALSGSVDALESFVSAGVGFYTLYAEAGVTGLPDSEAYQMFGQMTTPEMGWLMAFKSDGTTYTNVYAAGKWSGWKSH